MKMKPLTKKQLPYIKVALETWLQQEIDFLNNVCDCSVNRADIVAMHSDALSVALILEDNFGDKGWVEKVPKLSKQKVGN